MLYPTTPDDYAFASGALTFTLNALGDGNKVAAYASGSAVLYVNDIYGKIPFGTDGDYRFFQLIAYNTHFDDVLPRYVHVAIPRTLLPSDLALIVFPDRELDFYGRAATVPEGSPEGPDPVATPNDASEIQVGSDQFYYIFLGGIISAPESGQRRWLQPLSHGRIQNVNYPITRSETLIFQLAARVEILESMWELRPYQTVQEQELDAEGRPLYLAANGDKVTTPTDADGSDLQPSLVARQTFYIWGKHQGVATQGFMSALGVNGAGAALPGGGNSFVELLTSWDSYPKNPPTDGNPDELAVSATLVKSIYDDVLLLKTEGAKGSLEAIYDGDPSSIISIPDQLTQETFDTLMSSWFERRDGKIYPALPFDNTLSVAQETALQSVIDGQYVQTNDFERLFLDQMRRWFDRDSDGHIFVSSTVPDGSPSGFYSRSFLSALGSNPSSSSSSGGAEYFADLYDAPVSSGVLVWDFFTGELKTVPLSDLGGDSSSTPTPSNSVRIESLDASSVRLFVGETSVDLALAAHSHAQLAQIGRDVVTINNRLGNVETGLNNVLSWFEIKTDSNNKPYLLAKDNMPIVSNSYISALGVNASTNDGGGLTDIEFGSDGTTGNAISGLKWENGKVVISRTNIVPGSGGASSFSQLSDAPSSSGLLSWNPTGNQLTTTTVSFSASTADSVTLTIGSSSHSLLLHSAYTSLSTTISTLQAAVEAVQSMFQIVDDPSLGSYLLVKNSRGLVSNSFVSALGVNASTGEGGGGVSRFADLTDAPTSSGLLVWNVNSGLTTTTDVVSQSSFNALSGTVSSQGTALTTLQGTVAGHTTSISANATAIATNRQNISELAGRVEAIEKWFTLTGSTLHTAYALVSDSFISALGINDSMAAPGITDFADLADIPQQPGYLYWNGTHLESKVIPTSSGVDATLTVNGQIATLTVGSTSATLSQSNHTHSQYVTYSELPEDFVELINSLEVYLNKVDSIPSWVTDSADSHIAGVKVNSAAAADKASKLSNTTQIGAPVQPVYFSKDGVPVACNVPAEGTWWNTASGNLVITNNAGVISPVRGIALTGTVNATSFSLLQYDTSGSITLNNSFLPSSEGTYSLGSETLRWARLHVNEIQMRSNSTTFPLVLSYDAANYALRVRGNLYADGWISALGAQVGTVDTLTVKNIDFNYDKTNIVQLQTAELDGNYALHYYTEPNSCVVIGDQDLDKHDSSDFEDFKLIVDGVIKATAINLDDGQIWAEKVNSTQAIRIGNMEVSVETFGTSVYLVARSTDGQTKKRVLMSTFTE